MLNPSLARAFAQICCVLAYQAFALCAGGREPNVSFTNLTFRDGLPIGEINCSIRDNNGIVWIAGSGGLSRFDGYQVEQIAEERTKTLFKDSRGLLWAGTETSGLLCFDTLRKVKILSLDHSSSEPSKRLLHPGVTRIAEDKEGNLWVGTLAGLSKITVRRTSTETVECDVTSYRPDANDPAALPEGHITALLVDHSNRLWIGAAGKSLSTLHPQRNAFETVWESATGISTLYAADETHLWVGTNGNGLFLFDIRTLESREMSAGIASREINAAVMSKNGQMWVGTTRGLYRFNEAEGIFTAYYHEDRNPYSIASDHIADIREDSEGIQST